jgi:hypothetical protein
MLTDVATTGAGAVEPLRAPEGRVRSEGRKRPESGSDFFGEPRKGHPRVAGPAPMLLRHGVCGSVWSGAGAAHCGACHVTFSSLTAFDRHQRAADGRLVCVAPAEVGLVGAERPWGVLWSLPAPVGPSFWSHAGDAA